MTTQSERATESDAVLRVGYVLKRYPRFSETFIVNEILALEALGVEIVVFAFRPALEGCFHAQLAKVRARVEYLPATGQKSASLLQALRAARAQPSFKFDMDLALSAEAAELEKALIIGRRCQELGIQRLHAHFATSAASVARLASRFSNLPYTLTAHAKDIFHDSVDPEQLHLRLRDAQRIITVSDFNVRYLCNRWPDVAERITRIYNGMDLSDLHLTSYTERTQRVLAVGRLVRKKGFGALLRAAPLILKRHPEVHFDLVGEGALREELEDQVERLGLTERVHFYGALSQDLVFDMLRRARLFVAPCVVSDDGDRDGLPTVLLEAMALGTPCVATPVTGIPEAIEHEATGVLVDADDVQEFASACNDLLTDRERAGALAAAARECIEKKFDITRNVKDLVAVWTAPNPLQVSLTEEAL